MSSKLLSVGRLASALIGVILVGLIIAWRSGAFHGKVTADDASPEQILLKDYRPRSIYQVPQTKVAKARFPAIDVHSHDHASTEEEVVQWIRVMDQAGIKRTIILSMAHGKEFDAIIARYKKHADRFSVWCGLDYTDYDKPGYGPAAVVELERCLKAGAEGVGELVDKGEGMAFATPAAPGMHFDDARMDPLLEKCGELGMPVNIHVAEPKWMYERMDRHNDGLMTAYARRLDNQQDILSHAELLRTLERAVKKHPRTMFIACHFANCCYDLSKLGDLLDKYPNLYADISGRYAETGAIPRAAAEFYGKYQDRLLYGTDMGRALSMYQTMFCILETENEHFYDWRLSRYHWPLSGLGLEEQVLRKVYFENAEKILSRRNDRR
jgi:predicted TIM-barrel fold metal-dependent hydrolase